MRKVHISEYGKRFGFLRNFIAGEGVSNKLHIPNNPSLKHAFIKMLFLINLNEMKTRKEILDFYENNELIKHICKYGNSFTPYVDHYWSDLHRRGYIEQYREGHKIYYKLTEVGKNELTIIPNIEKEIFKNMFTSII